VDSAVWIILFLRDGGGADFEALHGGGWHSYLNLCRWSDWTLDIENRISDALSGQRCSTHNVAMQVMRSRSMSNENAIHERRSKKKWRASFLCGNQLLFLVSILSFATVLWP
jgi:hypothetical protein